ncbi:MAG: hypothetical protein MR773_01915 [Eubacterium coprostanoligenes]|nr:hypothetical protein [Eubacterium coprostanoligenes]
MTLTSDLILYHPLWEKADSELVDSLGLYKRLVDIFIIACSIGIQEDKTITTKEISEPLENYKYIGRNTYMSPINADLNDSLNFMLQNAIINSSHIDWDDETRLEAAFNPGYVAEKFRPSEFLISFANYGIEEIFKHVKSSSPSIAQEELLDYYNTLVEKSYYDGIELNYNLDDE